MLVKTYGSAVYGVEAITITIEVNVTEGLHTFVVGLPDNAVKESIQRVESAIKTNGYYMPRTKVIINLAPAGIRKTGPAFDLPIALGILAATQQVFNPETLQDYIIMGELSLDGAIQPIKGALPMAISARREKIKGLILPERNGREAAFVKDMRILAFRHLRDVVGFLNGTEDAPDPVVPQDEYDPYSRNAGDPSEPDFQDVKGQLDIKRALEIAAAGGHNTILIGPPGVGKTMLAKRLPGILPPLSLQEALETTRIHSVAGKLAGNGRLIASRPFRSPHHTISSIALVGGSSNPQPGEISLAHNGVLFLDELPEFSRNVLEVMRQPMEDRKITISRAKMSVDFPADFILLASMNPCPCGYYNHPEKECVCPPGAVMKYFNKVSGPLLDRIDLHIEVQPVSYEQLSSTVAGESSRQIRERVIAARELQKQRYGKPGRQNQTQRTISCNAQIGSQALKEICRIDAVGEAMLQVAMAKLHLSARAHERILKVSRTIADLAGEKNIRPEHLAEALTYRSLDREVWTL